MALLHGSFGTVGDVGSEVAEVGNGHALTGDAACAGFVNDEQMIGAVLPGDIDVFAQFDRALGAEKEKPAVTPGRKAVGGKPVDADVAARLRGLQRDFAEILEAGCGAVFAHGGRQDGGVFGAREGQELVDLVAGDVIQYAAVRRFVPEPRGAQRAVEACGRDDGLHQVRWAPDCTSSSAFSVDGVRKRSEKQTDQMRPVSATTRSISATARRTPPPVYRPSRPCLGAWRRWLWRAGHRDGGGDDKGDGWVIQQRARGSAGGLRSACECP